MTNEEYELIKNDINNIKVINKVCSKYKNLSKEELESCGLKGLLRCIKCHKEGMQKFTTSLWRFVDWECKRRLREIKNFYKHSFAQLSTINIEFPEKRNNFLAIEIRDCLNQLKPQEKSLLEDYFLKNMTMEEISKRDGLSKETVRQKLKRSMSKFKRLYGEKNGLHYSLC